MTNEMSKLAKLSQVLPPPSVAEALSQPLTDQLLVTDVGCYPVYHDHSRERPHGCEQLILLMCVDGAGWWQSDGAGDQTTAGELVIIPPGHPHSYGADVIDPWTLWWIHLGGQAISQLVGQQSPFNVGPTQLTVTASASVVDGIRRCLTHYADSTDQATRVRASLSAWSLLDVVAQAAQSRPSAIADPLIADAIRFARSRLANPPDLTSWAAEFGLRSARFSQRYREATGCSPMDHLMRLRLQAAAAQLDTSDATIASIAAAVGFDDQFHFSRRFRQVYDCSPSEWRARPKG